MLICPVQQEVENWLEEHIPQWKSAKFLIAVSGGVDSMVLLRLFHSLGLNFKIAHCNFQLRGKESDGDEKLVRDVAKKLSVEFLTTRFNTQQEANDKKLSIQETARELRYAWFEELRSEHQLDYVVIGTHKSDEVETVLINLIRGGGLRGIHGILPVRDVIIRPLLSVDREAILKYARKNQITWREDSSNASYNYMRNKIRHQIVPILKKIRPNAEQQITEGAQHIRDYEKIISNEIDRLRSRLLDNKTGLVRVKKKELSKLDPAYLYLYELICEFGFSFPVCKDVITSLNKQVGGLFNSATHTLVNDREYLIITPADQGQSGSAEIAPNTGSIEMPIGLRFNRAEAINYQLEKESNIAELDFDRLSFPLMVRPWREGDRFQPLGMAGFKKLSDFLVDEKVPRTLKNRVFILESAGEIVWIVGMRIDDRFKINQQTETIYRVSSS